MSTQKKELYELLWQQDLFILQGMSKAQLKSFFLKKLDGPDCIICYFDEILDNINKGLEYKAIINSLYQQHYRTPYLVIELNEVLSQNKIDLHTLLKDKPIRAKLFLLINKDQVNQFIPFGEYGDYVKHLLVVDAGQTV